MLAKEKWQIKTIRVLEMLFEERKRQIAKHGEAMRSLPDGIGPGATWLSPYTPDQAEEIQRVFRHEYEITRGGDENPSEGLTRMHLVREELAEMFECDPDSPEFIAEALQVAGLCVQWIEYKIPDLPVRYRGYIIQTNGDIWHREDLVSRAARSVEQAEKIIDDWLNAP